MNIYKYKKYIKKSFIIFLVKVYYLKKEFY